jgi:thiamine biosynthesis protein ThiS
MDQLVTVLLNGQSRRVAADTSVAQLLAELGLAAGHVAVEVNLQLVPRAQHDRQSLAEGDRVEIVTLVGGG